MKKEEMAQVFEDLPVLSQYGLWCYKNSVTVSALAMAMEAVSKCEDLAAARDVLKKLHYSYAMASYGGKVDEKSE